MQPYHFFCHILYSTTNILYFYHNYYIIKDRNFIVTQIFRKTRYRYLCVILKIVKNNFLCVQDVFAAGTDTTTVVLEWAMTELLRHPEIMKKLQSEVRQVVKDKHNITDDDIEKMHYLKAVMKETMRFHTPIPLLVPRVARNDVEVMGYDVPVGTMVMINAWAIGRDPTSWDEPEKFRPERFLNSSVDFKGLDFELIPFGAGRRGCPGTAFAMATLEFTLANLMQKFDWELPHECRELDMSERPGVAIRRVVPLLAIGTKM